ncbi:unnamed protein product [Rhizophagus irregularis]|nr:unnamed protein product [Rhizophagus irregularis]
MYGLWYFEGLRRPFRRLGWASEVSALGWASEVQNPKDSFQAGLPGSKEWKRTKIRSGGLPNSEERKIKIRFRVPKNGKKRTKDRVVPKNGKEPRFVRLFGIFRRTKKPRFVWMDFGQTGEPRFISSGGLQTNEGIKIRSGRFRTNGRTKIRKFGWASEERKPKDKDSIGRLLKNENPKIKISSDLSEERKKTKDSCLPKNGKNQDSFSGLPSSEEQRKTKIRFGIFGKSRTKIRKYESWFGVLGGFR